MTSGLEKHVPAHFGQQATGSFDSGGATPPGLEVLMNQPSTGLCPETPQY